MRRDSANLSCLIYILVMIVQVLPLQVAPEAGKAPANHRPLSCASTGKLEVLAGAVTRMADLQAKL